MGPETATILGAILGALVAGPITYYFTIKSANRQEFNRAAAEFRDEFIEVKRLLAEDKTYDVAIDKNKSSVVEILDKFFVNHERAVIRFQSHLSTDKLSGFDKAWGEYCQKDDWQIPLAGYSQEGGNDPQKEIELMKLANIHLDTLLSFAKPI
ncbi:MAG: hypothetical protein HY885_08680 [Deltaproteobacteria bacterium]|nr:hypothetical protein [Deltaproteobacteria bacterium]